MTLIDTHCHLNMPPLGANHEAVLKRARERGVSQVVVPAYDRESWVPVLQLSGQQNVFAAIGIHPWVPEGEIGPLIQDIRAQVTQSDGKVVAIGEIGLDTKVEATSLKDQLPLLEAQLQLAVDLDLPVILHCRGAFDELLGAIQNHGGQLRGTLHAFSRSAEIAQQFIAMGIHIGLGGAITRPKARRVRHAAAIIPLENIVLETDSPSIGLDGVRPESTEPGHVRDIAEALAGLREVSVSAIARATTANARALFGIS